MTTLNMSSWPRLNTDSSFSTSLSGHNHTTQTDTTQTVAILPTQAIATLRRIQKQTQTQAQIP